MSKSTKKRRARERDSLPGAAPSGPTPPPPSTAVDEALFERVAASARAVGEQLEPGTWVHNGETLSLKYVAGDAATPRKVLVAVFQQGVVFHVEGDRQLSRRPGPWVEQLPTA